MAHERTHMLTYIVVEWAEFSKLGGRRGFLKGRVVAQPGQRPVALSNCEEPEQHGQNGRDI
jgi:hypothetical protein